MVSAYLNGVGLLGPGISDWRQGREVLTGAVEIQPDSKPRPRADLLPPNERRRAGEGIRLAMHVAGEAVRHAGREPADLPTLFSSSHGDLSIAHRNCDSLARDEPWISPTLFHNSVHNATAGYWHIATGSMKPSSSISGGEYSLAAGLLDAICGVHAEGGEILYVCADCRIPAPFAPFEHLTEDFGVALVLSSQALPASLAEICVTPTADGVFDACAIPALEVIRVSNPAARILPVLEILARGSEGECLLPNPLPGGLGVHVVPC